jgi:hypothetical protein
MGFVVGYAPYGLSPQIDGMPVILENGVSPGYPEYLCSRSLSPDYSDFFLRTESPNRLNTISMMPAR